jgi:hypothetical protein
MNALSDGMSAITTTATPPTLFDWKKTDDLRGLLLTSHKSMLTHRSHTEILVKAINQLRIPFADVSAEKRDEVEKHIRSPRRSGVFVVDANKPVGLASIAEKEERYEKLRLGRLQFHCQLLETQLNGSVSALDSLTRHWERYQGTVRELSLGVREAELVLGAAEQIDPIKRHEQEIGLGDPAAGINAHVAVERARINVERATQYLKQSVQTGKENPQFEPEQYRKELQGVQKLLKQVREENPDMKPLPAPVGVGGGFF